MTKRIHGMVAPLLMTACIFHFGGVGPQLSTNGREVQLMKGDPPNGCHELGTVSGRYLVAHHEDFSRIIMRNKAASMGANYVRLDSIAWDGAVSGTAFNCPDSNP